MSSQQAKAEKEFKQAKKAFKSGKSQAEKANLEKKRKALERALEQLDKLNTQVRMRGCVIPHQRNFTQPTTLELQAVDKEENKTIALGTSKLNYLDPRISVAWCKKYDVPIEKVSRGCQIFNIRVARSSLSFHFAGLQQDAEGEVPVGHRHGRTRLRVLSKLTKKEMVVFG